MRLAIIAPENQASIYQQAVARLPMISDQSTGWEVTIDSFVHDLESPDEIDRLLGRPMDFDACTMLSPNSINQEQLFRLAELDKSILVPASYTTIEMLNQMSQRWQQSQGVFVVARPQQFTAYARTIHRELEASRLGVPGLVRIHRWLNSESGESPHMALWNATTSEVELASSIFAGRPETIFAQPVRGEQSRRGIVVHLGFEHGMALIDCMSHPVKDYYSLSVIGSNGAAYADDHRNSNLLLKDKTLSINVAHNSGGLHVDWLTPQLAAFAAAIKNPSSPNSREPDRSVGDMTWAMQVSRTAVQCAEASKTAKRNGDQYELQ